MKDEARLQRASVVRPGPWSDPPGGGAGPAPPEPLTRAPWPPLLLAGLLLAIYGAQAASGEAARCAAGDPHALCARLAFDPAGLSQGRAVQLITALFIHGSWAHVAFNSVFAVAFGAPVSRLFGRGLGGGAAFFLFFLVCGALGNLGFAAVHPDGRVAVIGASGSVAGLMGAASRLIDRRNAVSGSLLAPFTSRAVVGMAAAWATVNLIVGVLGVDIGFGTGGQPVAWEAHLFGYAAGLLLIGPAARALGRDRIPP